MQRSFKDDDKMNTYRNKQKGNNKAKIVMNVIIPSLFIVTSF